MPTNKKVAKWKRPKKKSEEWKSFRISRMTLRPGDILVLRTEMLLDKHQVAAISDIIKEQLPEELHARCIIMTSGFQMAVLSTESPKVIEEDQVNADK